MLVNSPLFLLLLGVAGALGAVVRYLLSRFVTERSRSDFPYGTLLINVSGALLIALLFSLAGRHLLDSRVQLLCATGFLGGYTTYSTLSWEGVRLVRSKNGNRRGVFYFSLTYGIGLLAAWLGLWLGRVL